MLIKISMKKMFLSTLLNILNLPNKEFMIIIIKNIFNKLLENEEIKTFKQLNNIHINHTDHILPYFSEIHFLFYFVNNYTKSTNLDFLWNKYISVNGKSI